MDDRVFETLLVIDGAPIEAAGHIKRLKSTTGVDAADFIRKAAANLHGYNRLRIDFTPPKSLTATHTSIEAPSLLQGEFTHFKLVSKQLKGQRLNTGHGSNKIAKRQELEALEAQAAPAVPLLVDGSNNILETTRHNVFIVEGESLVTPPLDGRILPGVTRQVVISEAQKLGLVCREELLPLKRAKAASGMFLTSASIGIGWVEQCNDTRWPDITPVIRSLHKALAKRWRTDLKPA
jgi:para-aminobenzoate synthetase/4-amino-4-deoxychorismate lyase